jgi:N-acetylneuraminate synthase
MCDAISIGYSCSVWDIKSTKEIMSLEPVYIKVPSAKNISWDILDILKTEYDGKIHISLGMTTKKECREIYDFMKDRSLDVVYYHCTSAYPVTFDDVNLLTIGSLMSHEKGFSGHHMGIAIDLVAYTLGATWIERHFTLDRTMKGTDHAASLEPTGLAKLVRDLHNAQKVLTLKSSDILKCEEEARRKLK